MSTAKDESPRLRAPRMASPFHIVLLDPEIPQNTGNIARLSAALQCPLHLVGRLGFDIDEKSVRRAGIDYWDQVELERHVDLAHFAQDCDPSHWKLFSSVAKQSYLDACFEPGDALIFGCESRGLPLALLEAHESRSYVLPTIGDVRSHNLANTVGIAIYEACRQTGAFAALELR
jgi:tRNA (cytidine/uridine-2'-O-)-methyltransferase